MPVFSTQHTVIKYPRSGGKTFVRAMILFVGLLLLPGLTVYFRNRLKGPKPLIRNILPIKKYSFFLFLLLSMLIGVRNVEGAIRTATATGLWSSTTTWGGAPVPTSADAVVINSPFNVNIRSNAVAGSITGNGTISCNKNSSLTVGEDNTSTTFSGIISSTSTLTLTKKGSGTLTLSGANTYIGTTTISQGTIKLGSTTALGTTAGGTSITNGAVLDLNGFTLSTAEVLTLNGTGISSGGALINSSATATTYTGAITLGSSSTIAANNGTITLSGALSGAFILTLDGAVGGTVSGVVGLGTGQVTKKGIGSWKLSGTNTYSGVTTINAGVLSVATIAAGGTSCNLGSAASSAANLVLGGGTLQYTGSTASTNRAFTLTTGTTSKIDVTANSLTITGASANTNGSLIKIGAGTLVLGAANAYTGTTTVNAGTLKYGIANALSSGAVTIDGATAVLNMLNFSDNVGTVTLDNGGSITGSSGVLISTNFEMKSGSVSAILGGAGIALNKTTNGTVILSGANTYSGVTTVSAGTLIAGTNSPSGNAGAFGNALSAIILGNAATTANNSSPTLLTGGAYTIARPITVANQTTTGTYSIGGNTDTNSAFSGAISILQALTVTQATTSGANNVTISGGISTGATCSGTKVLTFDNLGTVTIATTAISNGICTIAVVKQNTGMLTMNVANTYTGGTTLNSGTININNTSALGGVAGTFLINGGTIDNTSGGAITTVNYPQTWGGNFSFTGSNNLNLGTGAVTLSNHQQLTVSANTLTVGGAISGASYNLTKLGAGTLAMGASTVTLKGLTIGAGPLTATSGTMNIAGDFSNSGTFTNNNGTVILNGASGQTILGSSTTTFNNLNLNNGAGLSITTSPVITGTLTFTSGKIITGTNNVTLGATATSSGAGAGKYIYGNEIINIPNASAPSKTFDIGDATNYTPVILAFMGTTTGSGSVTASTTAGQHPNISTSGINYSLDVARYYRLTNNGVGGFTSFTPTFTFVAGDVIGGANTANFSVKNYNAGWPASFFTNGTRTSTTTQATAVSTFGDFAIGEPQALDHFTLTLASPQSNGISFVGVNTLTAYDISNNIFTLFDASVNNVTLTANPPLVGTISGLSSGNKLTSAADFVSGVANLTALNLKFSGNEATSTFTATSATVKTGTSGNVLIDVGALTFATISTQTAGTSFAVTVIVKDNNGNLVNAITNSSISLSLVSGTGTLGGTLTGTILAGSSNVTISGITYPKAESVSLLASQTSGTPGFSNGTSNTFLVNAGAASKLVVSNIASPQTAGAGFNATVTSYDANNNLANVTSASGISLSVATGTGNLSTGTTLGTIANGTNSVTISGVKYSVAQNDVSLTATQSSGTPAMSEGTSNLFVVLPDPTKSSLSPASSSIVANGSTQVLTVQAKDAAGNNLSTGGSTVTITQSSGTGIIGPVTDNGNGTYTATVTSPTAIGNGIFIATMNGSLVKNGGASQTQATVTYIPGTASSAKSTLTPAFASIADDGTTTQTLTIQAKDANGNNLTTGGSIVLVSRLSGVGNVSAVTDNSNGTYTANVSSSIAGTGVFTATLGGSSVNGDTGSPSTSTISFMLGTVNAAASTLLPVYSTINADGVSTQDLTVQAKDATGNNLTTGGATVYITLSSGTGTIESVNDNNDGTYTATVTSPTATGDGLFVATINGNPVKSGTAIQTKVTVHYGSDASKSTLTPTSGSLTADNSSTIVLTVQSKDFYGNDVTVGGALVTITKSSGKGSIGSITDNGDGTYDAIVTAPNNANAGIGVFVATLNGSPVKSGTASQTKAIITFAGNADATKSILTPVSDIIVADGISSVDLIVQVKDANGYDWSTGGETVTITKSSGTGTITGVTDNLDGTYTATVTSPTYGSGVFVATLGGNAIMSGNGSQTQSTINYTPGVPTKLVYTTVPTTGTAGTAFSITVQSQDANGNPANLTSATTITLSKATGAGTLSGTLTGNIGIGTNSVTLTTPVYSKADAMTLTATASGGVTLTAVTSGTITFSAGAASKLAYTTEPATGTAGTAFSVTVQSQDANGNPANLSSATTITLSRASGTGTLSGTLTGTIGIGSNSVTIATLVYSKSDVTTLTATASGGVALTAVTSGNITFSAGAASKLAYTTVPATGTAGTVFGVTVQSQDANSNPANLASATTITLSRASGTGTLSGTLTGSIGIGSNSVTIATPVYSKADVMTLTATASGGVTLTAVTSGTITFSAGTATQIANNAGNGQSATVGSAVTVAPSVIVKDANNNVVSGVNVTFAVASGGGSATGLSATTDASGIATVGTWTLGTIAGTNTLTATSGSLTGSPVTFTATGTAGILHHFAISAISSPQTSGTAFNISITAKDANNNTVSSFTGTADISSTGTLLGGNGTTASFVAGVLASHSITINPGGSSLVITAQKTSGSESGTSNSFDVNNPTPAIASISPTNQCAGASAFVLTVNGSNFNSASVVYINGAIRTTSMVNSGQLNANILPTDIVTAGTFTITVNNPAPGGGDSNGSTFTVTSGTWVGTTSKDWHTASNWCGGIPTSATNVVVPSGVPFQPTISTNALCNNITITTGASLTINGSNTLTVSGNWTNNGNFSDNTGTVNFNGSTLINGSAVTTFNNIIISSSKTLTGKSNGDVFIVGNLVNDGNFTNNGGTITFSGTSAVSGTSATTFGNLVISESHSLTAPSSGQINVSLNFTNNGTFNHNGGKLVFTGSTQSIDGTSPTLFNNLEISNGSSTSINSAGQSVYGILFCNGTLNANGNLTLLSNSVQTALIDGSGSGEVLGNVTMQRYIPVAFGYKYFSSPFQAATVNEFADDIDLGFSFPRFYKYDENHLTPIGADMTGWTIYTAQTGLLIPLEGYAANFGPTPAPKTVAMTGVVNNRNLLNVTLFNHNRTYTQGFNLVGNPYPSPINWDNLGWTKTNIDNSVYFFSASDPGGNIDANDTIQYKGSYSSYVGGVSTGINDNNIAAMQSFFVHVTSVGSAVLGTTYSVRTNNLNPFFKEAKWDNRVILRFGANFENKNARADAAVIYFDDQASKKFDSDKDALKITNTDELIPNIYTLSTDSKHLSINGMPQPDNNTSTIPLGITTLSDGWINFTAKDISQLPSSLHIYLVDAEQGVTRDLKQQPEYRFYLKKGEYNTRFTLVFSLADIVKPSGLAEKMFTLSRFGNQLIVKLNLPLNVSGNLMVTNVLGQVILQKVVSEIETVEINPYGASSVYIVTLVSGKRKESEKILIRKDYE